jgi:alanine racemase
MVDLNALAHNYQEAVRYADGRKIIAVVKAGAYGHGAVAISRCLLKLGTDMLGVALLEEGQELRQAGINAPILVMGALFPAQAEAIVESGLTPVIFDKALAHTLSQAAEKRGVTIPVHVKIDTGMNRIGLSPEEAPAFIRELQKSGCLSVQGLMTHFADVDLRDKAFAAKQMDCFEALVKALEVEGIIIPHRHAANSAALLDYDRALFTMVRPGLMLYGYNPLEEDKSGTKLRPALSLTTRIACIKNVSAGASISYGRTFVTKRESVIATLPIGYADGYSRGLSNKGEALVRGIRVPVVGRVCMDMCMLDVTEVPDVQAGDEVVLIGKQGQITITADDLAAKTGTIAYEVLCGITSRIPRIYV